MIIRAGGKIITLPKFEPESYIKALVTYKPTFLNLVPPLVSFLASQPIVKSSHLSSGIVIYHFGLTAIQLMQCSSSRIVFCLKEAPLYILWTARTFILVNNFWKNKLSFFKVLNYDGFKVKFWRNNLTEV